MTSSPSTVDAFDTDRKLSESPTNPSKAQQEFEIIPEAHDNRTLVLCFDGTGDKFDSDVRNPSSTCSPNTTSLTTASWQNSNVVQFISLLKKDNKREQMVYYQVRPSDRPYGTTLTFGTEDWNRHICREARPRFFHTNGQEDVKITGRGCSLEPSKSHAVFVLD